MTTNAVHFCVTLFLVSSASLSIAAHSADSSGHNTPIARSNPQAAELVQPHQYEHQVLPSDPPGVCLWYNSTDQVVVEDQSSCYSCIQQCDVEPNCKAAVYVSYRAARVHLDATACQETEATLHYSPRVGRTQELPVVETPSALPHSLGGVLPLPVSSRTAAPMLPITPPLKPMTPPGAGRRELTAVTQSLESPAFPSPLALPQVSSPHAPPQPPSLPPTQLPSSRLASSPMQAPAESPRTSPLPSLTLRTDVTSRATRNGPSLADLPALAPSSEDSPTSPPFRGGLALSSPPHTSPAPSPQHSPVARSPSLPKAACNVTGCVAAGVYHTCAVTTTGRLGCWGSNDNGEIDVPTNFSSNIVSVGAGSGHTCAVTTTGGLGCWGINSNGQIDVPANFSSSIAFVSTGGSHTCATTTTGRLGCWGRNEYGQIDVPANFSSNIALVSTGGSHTCAVTTTGILGCWGYNQYDQTTVPANFSSNIAFVSTGFVHTCAVTTSGRLGCWGSDGEGRIDVPANFSSNIASVGAGDHHTCAATTSGSLGCWGYSGDGQLALAAAFAGFQVGTVAVAAGALHTCAVRRNGVLRCAGDNTYGQTNVPQLYRTLIDNSGSISPRPPPLTTCKGCVAAGWRHTCAVTTTGRLGCWGGDEDHITVPSNFSSNIASVSAGSFHTCAVTTTGRLGCWGSNFEGQTSVPSDFISNIASISAGSWHTCAVTTSASLGCWGRKDFGQITIPSDFISDIASISAGDFHTCAVTTTGRLGCWGYNQYGQIDVPANFSSNIASVSTGGSHTCAVTTTGRVGCWGSKSWGQIDVPANFSSNIVSISAGGSHTCAVTTTGAVGCWGKLSLPSSPQFSSGVAAAAAGFSHVCVMRLDGAVRCVGDNEYGQSSVSATMRNLLHDRALVPQENITFGYCPAFCDVAPSKCDNSGICGVDEEGENGACINGYYLTTEGTCGSCDEANPNCFACDTFGCGVCRSGFYFNTEGACESCSDPNCQSCPNGVCEKCLPYYTKDSDGACVPGDFDCAEGEYPFHCVGKKCRESGFYTSSTSRGCISRLNCDLLYTECLVDVGVDCEDCCIRVTTDSGKQWYLMRFSNDLLVQCDPPPSRSRQCKWSPWNVNTRCGWNRRCEC